MAGRGGVVTKLSRRRQGADCRTAVNTASRSGDRRRLVPQSQQRPFRSRLRSRRFTACRVRLGVATQMDFVRRVSILTHSRLRSRLDALSWPKLRWNTSSSPVMPWAHGFGSCIPACTLRTTRLLVPATASGRSDCGPRQGRLSPGGLLRTFSGSGGTRIGIALGWSTSIPPDPYVRPTGFGCTSRVGLSHRSTAGDSAG